MARKPASRKYQLTINNPRDHGFTHDDVKNILAGFSGLEYWCMCDEVGKEETPHTHVYLVFSNAVMFTTLQKRFYGAHIEPANGSNQENRDYIRKEGKWLDDEKSETSLIGTFEESGELPLDKSTGLKESAAIYQMLKDGASNYEIVEAFPSAMNKIEKLDNTRQMILAEQWKRKERDIEVYYIWGEPGVGKTRGVIDKHGYENIYRITNYKHPFDTYSGQDVIVFEEFDGNDIPITEMLQYLDRYPVLLPCRYQDKWACYTKVYIISNNPLESQYKQEQYNDPKKWAAFKRRIHDVTEMLPVEKGDFFDWTAELPNRGVHDAE